MLSFNLVALKAYSLGLQSQEAWQDWAKQPNIALPEEGQFKPSLIPMMQARRMSVTDKMAIQLALELNSQHAVDFVVFASRHGQLPRTYKLLANFAQTREMSPTDFATAVHNAPAGLFSILAQQTAPISSVAAEENTFCAAMLEALLALQGEQYKSVLLVVFDDNVPAFYLPYLPQTQHSSPFALGMVLTNGSDWQLNIQNGAEVQENPCLQALAFLREFYQQTRHFTLHYGQQQWQFSRN